jgi:hypothetical protein
MNWRIQMLNAYKPIKHSIYKAHGLIEYLVNEVWCKADVAPVENKLNSILKSLYNNSRLSNFKTQVNEIYIVCRNLTDQEKQDFQTAFKNNNKIEELCNGKIKPIPLSVLNKNLVEKIEPFFKGLYSGFLGWKLIQDKFGDKKAYYDELNLFNRFIYCPCCGYGDLKTFNSRGKSAFDHYLPQKYYPLSATNFNNLVPICSTCNSDEKGEVDVLKWKKPIYYPFTINHPKIVVTVDVNNKVLQKLIQPTDKLENKITNSDIIIDFNIKDDCVDAWDKIFKIKLRYLGKIADNRVGWLDCVRSYFKRNYIRISNYSVEDAFIEVIEDDSNKHLGFLKSPYLNSIKANKHLLKAIKEVTGSSIVEV